MKVETTHKITITNNLHETTDNDGIEKVKVCYGHVDVDCDFLTNEKICDSAKRCEPLDGSELFYYVGLYTLIRTNKHIKIEKSNSKTE